VGKRKFYSSKEKNYSSKELVKMEHDHAAHNYHPIPIVVAKSKGVFVWDPEGNKYFDFLSAYSALNQGHNHPRIVKALQEQAKICSLTSRAYFNSEFPVYAQFITKLFGYDKVLPMNAGAEAVETSIKLARKWGHMKKGIPLNKTQIISCSNCFHGRTYGAISLTTDPLNLNFGPLLKGIKKIKYNNLKELENVLNKYSKTICAFIVEPIQGEAGVIVPNDGYLKEAYKLCKKHNVLFIVDEVQTGLGRTGKLLASHWEGIKPDVVLLGKALSGGLMPISAILADDDVMLCIKVGEHGSTFGGNPLASVVAREALSVIIDENLSQNALEMGKLLQSHLLKSQKQNKNFVKEVRGRGLLQAIELKKSKRTAWDLCLLLKSRGLLAKPTHQDKIRLAPPLVITEQEINSSAKIITQAIVDIQKMETSDIPDYESEN